ncbi:MAG: alpha/beta fold hydrolase [Terracidiphilus sp.]
MTAPNRMSVAGVLALAGKVVVAVAVLTLAAGLIFQWSATKLDERRYPMPGVLVEVNGHRMHLDCRGQGSPTVVMDAGLGDSASTWSLVQPEVAKFTRVCSYDRPGFGWSGAASVPRDTKHVAAQLHDLLQQAHIEGPYLLVGHSFGGYNQLMFQSLYPDQVVGIVLVDSSHPNQENRLPGPTMEDYAADLRWKARLAPFGVQRLMGWCRDDYVFPNAPEAWQQVAPVSIALDCRTPVFPTTLDEMYAFRESGKQVAAVTTLHALPLIVLSHDPQVGIGFPPEVAAEGEKQWNAMQEELRGLSTNSKRVIARGSMHYVESYRAELVIQAIREVFNAARTGQTITAATTEQ